MEEHIEEGKVGEKRKNTEERAKRKTEKGGVEKGV